MDPAVRVARTVRTHSGFVDKIQPALMDAMVRTLPCRKERVKDGAPLLVATEASKNLARPVTLELVCVTEESW